MAWPPPMILNTDTNAANSTEADKNRQQYRQRQQQPSLPPAPPSLKAQADIHRECCDSSALIPSIDDYIVHNSATIPSVCIAVVHDTPVVVLRRVLRADGREPSKCPDVDPRMPPLLFYGGHWRPQALLSRGQSK